LKQALERQQRGWFPEQPVLALFCYPFQVTLCVTGPVRQERNAIFELRIDLDKA
jgi:hypothetical protein